MHISYVENSAQVLTASFSFYVYFQIPLLVWVLVLYWFCNPCWPFIPSFVVSRIGQVFWQKKAFLAFFLPASVKCHKTFFGIIYTEIAVIYAKIGVIYAKFGVILSKFAKCMLNAPNIWKKWGYLCPKWHILRRMTKLCKNDLIYAKWPRFIQKLWDIYAKISIICAKISIICAKISILRVKN